MANGKRLTFLLTFAFCLWPCRLTWAKEDVRNELPGISNLQSVVLQKAITLSWQWQAPEELPIFTTFGYEVKRQDGKKFLTSQTTYTDSDLSPGSYMYVVRARGLTKEKGKQVIYISDWSEPAGGQITSTCPRPPALDLAVEPTQKKYAYVASLRLHIQGHAAVESGCQLGSVTYHLDTGTGIVHTAPLPVDTQGHFDAFVNAFGPEDEIPSGQVSLAITVTAEDEAGPVTSNAFTIDVDLENPFAPHNP
jgi:hypothetical protein